jgi:hypothetical protein
MREINKVSEKLIASIFRIEEIFNGQNISKNISDYMTSHPRRQ